jgi:hypothetical protein
MGVVTANAAARIDLCRKPLGIIAILEPKANPSKIWWKTMTMNSVMNPESAATTSVKPMRIEWKMIPASMTAVFSASDFGV